MFLIFRPKYPKKYKTQIYLAPKKIMKVKPHSFAKCSTGAHSTRRVQHFKLHLSKRRGYWTLKEFGAISLNPPVEILGMAPPPEKVVQAIHSLGVDYRGHVHGPYVRDNLAGDSCVLRLCASALCAGFMAKFY